MKTKTEIAETVIIAEGETAESFDLENNAELVDSLNRDLLDLMKLGEFDKAIDLSRRYNYFNQYGNLILNLVHQGKFDESLPLIEDLLLGPLFQEVISLNENESEIYYLPRLLVLVEVLLNSVQPSPVSPLTIYLLSKLGSRHQFSAFLEQVHKIEHLDDNQNKLGELILEYSFLAFKKIDELYDLRGEFFSAELDGQSFDLTRNQRMYVLGESDAVEEAGSQTHPGVLVTVLRNLEEFMSGEGAPQYELSQLKLDLMTVREAITAQEMASYVAINKMYDLMPDTAMQLAKEGNYLDSASLLAILVQGSNLYTQKHDFRLELLKQELASLGIYTASKLSPEDFSEVFESLAWTWPTEEAKRLINCRLGHGGVECKIEQLEGLCASILEAGNRAVLKESKAPRPSLTIEEAVNF